MLSRAFDHICMEKARYKFLIIIIIIIIVIIIIIKSMKCWFTRTLSCWQDFGK